MSFQENVCFCIYESQKYVLVPISDAEVIYEYVEIFDSFGEQEGENGGGIGHGYTPADISSFLVPMFLLSWQRLPPRT